MHTVGVLVAFGADATITNAHNMTPVDLAPLTGHLREFLNQFASKPKFTSIVK